MSPCPLAATLRGMADRSSIHPFFLSLVRRVPAVGNVRSSEDRSIPFETRANCRNTDWLSVANDASDKASRPASVRTRRLVTLNRRGGTMSRKHADSGAT